MAALLIAMNPRHASCILANHIHHSSSFLPATPRQLFTAAARAKALQASKLKPCLTLLCMGGEPVLVGGCLR